MFPKRPNDKEEKALALSIIVLYVTALFLMPAASSQGQEATTSTVQASRVFRGFRMLGVELAQAPEGFTYQLRAYDSAAGTTSTSEARMAPADGSLLVAVSPLDKAGKSYIVSMTENDPSTTTMRLVAHNGRTHFTLSTRDVLERLGQNFLYHLNLEIADMTEAQRRALLLRVRNAVIRMVNAEADAQIQQQQTRKIPE